MSPSPSAQEAHFGPAVSSGIQQDPSIILEEVPNSDPIIIDDLEDMHDSGILPTPQNTLDMGPETSPSAELAAASNDPSSGLPPPIPEHVQSPALNAMSEQIHHYRIFLDICAGVTRPLSQAILAHHCDVISFDILLHDHMDLLADDSYEALLKISASGAIAYGAASPACAQYSRLKLRADAGPKALRTPEHLQGVPGLTPHELAKVQTSYTMLSRCLTCLSLVHAAGGHVHLEQPPSAMSWLEPETKQFVKSIGIYCINLAACLYGKDWHKSWMFASSFGDLRQLGGVCPHPYGSHQTIVGQFNQAGDFLSKETACYPIALAQAFAARVAPLLSNHAGDIPWNQRQTVIPIKTPDAFPRSQEDGGGLFSQPDWSQSGRSVPDSFAALRKSWLNRIISQRLDKKLLAFCQLESSDPPFSDEDLLPFRQDLEQFLVANSQTPDWQVREHQPMCLNILKSLSLIMQDEDRTLFDSLINGVSTGFQNDIPLSGCFPRNDRPADPSSMDSLSAHFSNWQSATDHPNLTRELVQEEIDKGWVFEYEGTLAEAQAEFPSGVALGKLGIAISEGRPPRLVVDQSICGLNQRCHVPERSTLPSAKDIIRSYPIRGSSADLLGFSLDIKSAHKRIVIKDSEWGLVGFTLDDRIYFYRVCPFGATFSAAWWSRVGAFILRCFHRLIWLIHVALLYVDDFFIYQDKQILPCTASLLCVFVLLTRIPISWKKCELSSTLKWIGWSIHIQAGYITIPDDKLRKVSDYLDDLLHGNRTTRKRLEKAIGICMWLTQLWPYMRIWIHHWYRDLYSIPASLFSVNLHHWAAIVSALNSDLKFVSSPIGTGIPNGGTLVSIGHSQVHTLQDVHNARLRDRIWLRIRDPNSHKRKLSPSSRRIIALFQAWFNSLQPIRVLRPRIYWPGTAAADAMAHGDICQIGGFVDHNSSRRVWFSESFNLSDFTSLQIDLKPDLQKSITCLEALAQIALIWITAQMFPGHRLPICLKSLSDNTGAEASSNAMFTMSQPLCFFIEKLCLVSVQTGIEIDVSHIPGHDNYIADDLSRWNQSDEIPHSFLASERIRISLSDLWVKPKCPCFTPANLSVPWSLPQ